MSINPDLAKERHDRIDVEQLKEFLGVIQYSQPGEYENILKLREALKKRIKPIYEENFYNLNRDEKYQIILKKSLEICDFAKENGIDLLRIQNAKLLGSVFGIEKFLFGLHASAFELSIRLWGTDEQKGFWEKRIKNNAIFGTYVQTELGHGTFVRGLETTATYDKKTKEFVLDSPTLTSTKFWPGALGKTCNHAIVMAKLVIDGKDYGIQAFVVQLRSLENHKSLPGIELGDIGHKYGFETTDNGYLRFNKFRIPLDCMLMKMSHVTPEGVFERKGSELIMYASMLVLRALLGLVSATLLSFSTTIAIRYSCVRRQTANLEGKEPQIIDYQTQQYRLFPALSTTYAYYFTACSFIKNLLSVQESTNNFNSIIPSDLAKLHALSSALKAASFYDALKFAQSNRHCCGGHGYSQASGLPQIIAEIDAGCTYEGDNTILFLQTARYLLKCAQNNISPHFELPNINEVRSSQLYSYLKQYYDVFHSLYDELIGDISNRMLYLVNEKGLNQYDAWNVSSVQLTNVSKAYINIYVINCFLSSVLMNKCEKNQKALVDLLELYLLYGICDIHSANILKFGILNVKEMSELTDKLYDLLPKIRDNCILLVDAFDWHDSNLCSALGAYDGNVYERLYEYAKNSAFNKTDVHEGYEKYLKPYQQKLKSKL